MILDRPGEGILKVSQRPVIELGELMREAAQEKAGWRAGTFVCPRTLVLFEVAEGHGAAHREAQGPPGPSFWRAS